LPPPAGTPPLPAWPLPLLGVSEPPPLPHAASVAASEQALARATKRGALHLSPFSARIPRIYPRPPIPETDTGTLRLK